MENLTPEEQHAATDLALYTVNTGTLYPRAQEIMWQIARNPCHNRYWIGHAKEARRLYQKEMGADDHSNLFFREHVLQSAAFQIAEHYAEEQAEIARRAI